jgi:DNA polymerase I-like protein with 3'-5' exonuclease and polymerase domains
VATVNERTRHELYLSIEALIGATEAETLMSMLPPAGLADVATKADIVAVKADLVALEQRMDLRFESAQHQMESAIHQLTGEMHIGLHNQLRTLVFALLGALFTMMTLNLTAIALLR